MAIINPFQYGGVVGPDSFCNRKRELIDLTRAIENGDRLFVYAERRMGKTSLIKLVLSKLDPQKYVSVYVDLWPTDDTDSFIRVTAKAIAEATASTADKLLETTKEFFSLLRPSVTLDDSGYPKIQFGAHIGERQIPALEEVLAAPPKVARKTKRRLVMIFDEFQQILQFKDHQIERSLRSAAQHHTEVAYLFLGSRKHLIEQMFVDSRNPLYRSAGHYPLLPIHTEEWVPFISVRFESTGKSIEIEQVEELCELSDGHPFYTQHLAHALWELTPQGDAVKDGMLTKALNLLLRRESYAFSTQWETLTKNQRRFLRGLASEQLDVEPFSARFLQANALGAPSSAQRAASSLLKLDLVDREEGVYFVTDRFFKLWIQRL